MIELWFLKKEKLKNLIRFKFCLRISNLFLVVWCIVRRNECWLNVCDNLLIRFKFDFVWYSLKLLFKVFLRRVGDFMVCIKIRW